MFGISLQKDNDNEDSELSEAINVISNRISKSTKNDGVKFIIGFLFLLIFFLFILCLLFFGLFSLSAFAWNSSFAVFFNLPVLSWINIAFGYTFIYVIYRMIKFIF
tara:strand:+ start:500 stop:817 length:318 start_codon:yes stop_codon:yes gene_type:complete